MKETTERNLADYQKRLLDAADDAKERAYAPVSHFMAGASVLTRSGAIVTGCNFESVAFTPTTHAEQTAIVRANAEGHRDLKAMAVMARLATGDTSEINAPCGFCRQIIFEASQLSGADIEIILSTTRREKIILTSIQELLPLAFGPLSIGIDIQKFR